MDGVIVPHVMPAFPTHDSAVVPVEFPVFVIVKIVEWEVFGATVTVAGLSISVENTHAGRHSG